MAVKEHIFDTLMEASQACATYIAELLQQALLVRESASLAVSGGQTPRQMLSLLNKAMLPWSAIGVTLADERWVPPHHPKSNEKLLRETLLRYQAANARFFPLYMPGESPEQAVNILPEVLHHLPLPLDVVQLGMGDDGHFASLFPYSPALLEIEQLLVAVPPEDGGLPRLSLSRKAIFSSRHLILLISGKEKLQTYLQALRPGDPQALPIRYVLHQEAVAVDVFMALQ
jgi:6-phosphogluconolactonase